MVCRTSCLVAIVFLVSMIYTHGIVDQYGVIKQYRDQLTPELNARYQKISDERRGIFYRGYLVGFVLSVILLLLNKYRGRKTDALSMVCIIVSVSFITNYLFYLLSPKSDWMLNHIRDPKQTQAWLAMYRTMQVYHHGGLALGLIAMGFFAYAFRC